MEDIKMLVLYSILSIFSFLALKFLLTKRNNPKNLPPSPWAFPIIGHLHLLKQPIHRTFHSLSQQYGPIISLRFGSRPVVLVSSAELAEECFTKHDVVFANRPSSIYGKYINYNNTTIGAASYGDHWRNLRKLSTIEIFSATRLSSFLDIRRDEVKILMRRLHRLSGGEFVKVDMRMMLTDLTFNLMLRMIAGKRYYGEDVSGLEEAKEFREIMDEISNRAAAMSVGELIPVLQRVGFGGFVKKLEKLRKRMDWFFQQLIDENRANRDRNTLINHLLTLQESEPQYYTDEIIKGLILMMLQAGTRTSSLSLEWTIANLLNNPEVLNKAAVELETQMGVDRLIDEPDVSKLPYLHSIIYENLRLYPVAPFLTPHLSSADCTVGGYHVPRGTMLLVNIWTIHRDPKLWEDDPASFRPERFENGRSEASKLMPFGLGRRSCPGEGLASRVMALTLGSLVQCFEWKKSSEGEIDMSEKVSTTMRRAEPLVVMCKSRPNITKLIS